MFSIHRHRKKFVILLLLALMMTLPISQPVEAQGNEKELFLVAQKAFDDGFYDVAIRYIDQFMVQYPKTDKLIQAKLLLGQCYFFKNKY